jgi:hypothetical protein
LVNLQEQIMSDPIVIVSAARTSMGGFASGRRFAA